MAVFTMDDSLKKKEEEKLLLQNQQKNYGTYKQSDYVTGLQNQAMTNKSNLDNFGNFQFSKQNQYDTLENNYLNRPNFSYDLNADMLYQQYKDQYMTQGKQAMMDTMGQAAALTGGYGNSYAQTVGQQTYQGYLQGLNDKVPELYQLALQRYKQEGDDMADRLGLLYNDRNTEYGEYTDRYNRLADLYSRNYGLYRDEYDREHTEFEDGYGRINDALTTATNEYNNAYNMAYAKFRDDISDQQFNQQLAAANNTAYLNSRIASLQDDVEKNKFSSDALKLYTYLQSSKDNGKLLTDEQKAGIKAHSYTEDEVNREALKWALDQALVDENGNGKGYTKNGITYKISKEDAARLKAEFGLY